MYFQSLQIHYFFWAYKIVGYITNPDFFHDEIKSSLNSECFIPFISESFFFLHTDEKHGN
jgi:hypothetical protein